MYRIRSIQENKKSEEKEDKILYFNTDDDFYTFCVVPVAKQRDVLLSNGQISSFMDFDLSNDYWNAVNDGKYFVIKDPKSQIFKHKAVSYRTMTKPIKNLKHYMTK